MRRVDGLGSPLTATSRLEHLLPKHVAKRVKMVHPKLVGWCSMTAHLALKLQRVCFQVLANGDHAKTIYDPAIDVFLWGDTFIEVRVQAVRLQLRPRPAVRLMLAL